MRRSAVHQHYACGRAGDHRGELDVAVRRTTDRLSPSAPPGFTCSKTRGPFHLGSIDQDPSRLMLNLIDIFPDIAEVGHLPMVLTIW